MRKKDVIKDSNLLFDSSKKKEKKQAMSQIRKFQENFY